MGTCASQDAQNKCIPSEKPYKIDTVKESLRRRISEPDLASTKIGMVELGNYKAQNLEKKNACLAIRTLVPTNSKNQSQIINALDQIQVNDDGATPIADAIDHAATELEKQNSSSARILLISDGDPNCNKGFLNKKSCRIVDALSQSKIKFHLDVIGYKTGGKDKEFIECAAKHPDMVTYLSTNTPEELNSAIDNTIPKTSKPTPTYPPCTNISGESNDWSNKIIFLVIGAFISEGVRRIWDYSLDKKSKEEHFAVRVSDESKIIEKAKVSLESKHILIIDYTNSEGRAEFAIKVPSPKIRILVEADGYQKYDRTIDISDGQAVKEIKLSPLPINP
jgi:von Willebrand factor type A domain